MTGYRIDPKDIALLRSQGMQEEDLTHSIQVAEKALEIAKKTGALLDMEFIGRGALFHDLGKVITHDITHGLIGAQKGAAIGLPPAVNLVMEKHIRGGLTREEALELGLPVKDYGLHRLEERIIIYADRLVDIIHDGIIEIRDEGEAESRFKEILTDTIKYGKNEITKLRYFGYHDEIQGLIFGEIVDVAGLKTKLTCGVTLLDVRKAVDVAEEPDMIPGAIWKDPDLVSEWLPLVAPDQEIVLYCSRGGEISRSISAKLRKKGICVSFLSGGLYAWRDATCQ